MMALYDATNNGNTENHLPDIIVTVVGASIDNFIPTILEVCERQWSRGGRARAAEPGQRSGGSYAVAADP